MLYNILTGYLLIINLAGIYVMWSDKCRARSGAWRIKEKTLFLVALLGGSLGTTLGMHWFRHKTKHWYFRLGLPAILVAQVALAMWLRSFFM